MSGYFSQLIGQTGIALPQQNVLAQNVVSDIFSPESSGEEAPIQEEHVEVIVPQPEQPVSPGVKADREVRESDRVPKTISDIPEIPSVSQTVEPDHPPIMPEEGEQNAIAATPNAEPTILEPIEVQSFSESISRSQPSQSKEIKSSKDAENTPAPVVDRPLKITETQPIESVQVESKLDVTGSTKTPVNLPPTRQAYLQAILDWVGGTPKEIEEIQEISGQKTAESSQPNAKPATEAPNRQSAPAPFVLELSRQSEPQPPQEQDFVLSIGSIHLTIEAPQQETLPPPVLPTPPEPTVKPNYPASRLSRYYLRLR